jgi:hypothetical protein
MTLYYFNTQNDKLELDPEGSELANIGVARPSFYWARWSGMRIGIPLGMAHLGKYG